MNKTFRRVLHWFDRDRAAVERVNGMRIDMARLSDPALREIATATGSQLQFVAAAATAAGRVLGYEMHDVQILGALAMARGSIAEMQTGEGKTVAAVPAVAWLAKKRKGVHVMTVNDYLAGRDANWMGDIYRMLGLSIGHVRQDTEPGARKAAYACDITYATANEIGFDFLRDRLALQYDQQVHRPPFAAVIDEVDSILIDEARIPLVIAGGNACGDTLEIAADSAVRHLRPRIHYSIDAGGRNVAFTDAGIREVEAKLRCGNLFDNANLRLHESVQDALEAHALLHRDVDYLVREGRVDMVDEIKGRVAVNRRWPAGLQRAIETKEKLSQQPRGIVLGSTTVQSMVGLYTHVCGMTGTAATQAIEFKSIYDLRVEVIPTHRPVIREDRADLTFATTREKEQAVIAEIRRVHATGQPILVGTASVEESERLHRLLPDVPHSVLNARNDDTEASIVAHAGQLGAVTISTNMAGRGTDIRLCERSRACGGLYVLGTNRHESRRIDNQLRGRAGRQGDPGCSRFFISLEDPLMAKYGDLDPRYASDPESIQRLAEGHHLREREFLSKYDTPVEGQRHQIHTYRQAILDGTMSYSSERERQTTLRVIDDLWADHLARVESLRAGLLWHSYVAIPGFLVGMDNRDPLLNFLRQINEWFPELQQAITDTVIQRMTQSATVDAPDSARGNLWTYLTTDQPFGTWTERVLRGLYKRLSGLPPLAP